MSRPSDQPSPSLVVFKKKIDEAVSLVPAMVAEEKLKAVQFWNIISERLQEIVNNSAADINALAMQMEQDECNNKQQQEPVMGDKTNTYQTPTAPVRQDKLPPTPDTRTEISYLSMIDSQDQVFTPQAQISSDSHVDNDLIGSDDVDFGDPDNSSNQDEDDIERHLAVITALAQDSSPSNDHQPHLLIAFQQEADKKQFDNAVGELITKQEQLQTTTTTSVIQEVDRDNNSSSSNNNRRRNVIQSTQKALQVLKDVGVLDGSSVKFDSSQESQFNHLEQDEIIVSKLPDAVSVDGDSSASSILAMNHPDSSCDINDLMDYQDIKDDDESIIELKNNMKSGDKKINSSISSNSSSVKSCKKRKAKNKKHSMSDSDSGAGDASCDVCLKKLTSANHTCSPSKQHTCGECGSRFSTKGNLLVHQRRHTGEKPFACDQCSATFSTKGNLKRHVKAHSGERPWQCDQCSSRFTEKKSLKVHMRRHTGEKPYQCSVCGKAFSQTGVLQTHMALHLDERKHLCELCGKAFRQRSQLRLHVLRHEGVKRWACRRCDAKFLTKGDLERHDRVHTGERPFGCHLCGKTFTRQQSLNEHSNRHFGLKPYSCTVCGKNFAEMSACYKHIKVHKKQLEPQGQVKSGDKKQQSDDDVRNGAVHRRIAAVKSNPSQVNVIQSPGEKKSLGLSQAKGKGANSTTGNGLANFAINLLATASTTQQF